MRDELDQIIDEGWEWYTSNSYRRLGLSGRYNEVMYATNQADGHPDIEFKNESVKDLIGAAPNLLKALKAMVDLHIEDFGIDGMDNPVIDQACEAIAKAKGEQHG